MALDRASLARELATAYAEGRIIPVPPSGRDPAFDVATAYRVEGELVRMRRAGGHNPVGRKVGFANRALWRKFKLESVLWAHMYDDTVRYASGNAASLDLSAMVAPKIEPEILFKLKHRPGGMPVDAADALAAVEWLALGFEIVDCVFPDWKFLPQDFVAAYGLHAGLIVGAPSPVEPGMIPKLIAQLATVSVRLMKDGQLIAEGSGSKVLESPALCLAELAAGIARQPGADPLAAGEIIATGALTDNQFIAAGESWTAHLDGLDLPDLTLRTTA